MMDRQRLQTTFSEAEDYPVRNLRYWNESSDSATRTNAKSLAGQIDGYFIDQLGAKYHPGHGFASAITFVAEFLTVGSNTVGGLGKALDSIYKMRGEQGL
ncbi:MAG: hypothetical protein DWQ01_22645 [Planctomycetota bacterium]|nr:MAG: hypothetical protein DWQ01_22645 [Planctomycetota bacterium]